MLPFATPGALYIILYNGGPKSSDLIGSQLLYNERIHNCYDAQSFCQSITPRLEVESVKEYNRIFTSVCVWSHFAIILTVV